jgi:DNA-binding Lrp family transcriptional regulator
MTQGKQTVSDGDIVSAFKSNEAPFMTAIELATEFGMTRQWAHNRLQTLHEAGTIKRKKSGPRNVIWWLPAD